MRKIEDLTFFFIDSLRTEGKKAKNSPFRSRLTPSAKIEHVGVYFAKMGCKIEYGFTDIFGLQVRCFVFDRSDCVWDEPFTTGLLIRFAAKRKMDETISPWRSHLFFIPYFDFTLMNVYMNTGIK